MNFDASSGLVASISNKVSGVTTAVSQDWLWCVAGHCSFLRVTRSPLSYTLHAGSPTVRVHLACPLCASTVRVHCACPLCVSTVRGCANCLPGTTPRPATPIGATNLTAATVTAPIAEPTYVAKPPPPPLPAHKWPASLSPSSLPSHIPMHPAPGHPSCSPSFCGPAPQIFRPNGTTPYRVASGAVALTVTLGDAVQEAAQVRCCAVTCF